MSNTECTRCGGTGFYGPATIFNGWCFACNKGGCRIAVRPSPWTRAKVINILSNMLGACASHVASGEYTKAEWLASINDADAAPSLNSVLAIADADVRARFEAALAKVAQ